MKFTPFEGQSIQIREVPASQAPNQQGGLLELQINLKDDSVNKFNRATLKELREAVNLLKKAEGVQGLLVSSGKDVFVVGADITEFLSIFERPENEILGWIGEVNAIFSDFEDLPFPTLAATASAFGPSSSAAARNPSSLRATMTTRAPSRTNAAAAASPMPRDAPVTIATLPSSWRSITPL